MAKETVSTLRTRKKKSQLYEWTESIVIAFVLAMIIRAFVIQAFKIPTGSMRMTLLEGDAILVNKLLYGPRIPFTELRLPAMRTPRRGDVIVFIFPKEPKKDFIKRLVATEGETVEIKNGNIYVNGGLLSDPVFRQNYYYPKGEFYELSEKPVVVPKDSYFVLGDNSESSMDSRWWGFVPVKNLVGKAMVIYWPPQRIRLIK